MNDDNSPMIIGQPEDNSSGLPSEWEKAHHIRWQVKPNIHYVAQDQVVRRRFLNITIDPELLATFRSRIEASLRRGLEQALRDEAEHYLDEARRLGLPRSIDDDQTAADSEGDDHD